MARELPVNTIHDRDPKKVGGRVEYLGVTQG